jgi:hypothetical protein
MPIDRGFVTNRHVPILDSVAAGADLDIDFVELLMQGSGHRSTLRANTDAIRETLATGELDCLVHLPFESFDIGAPYEHARGGSVDSRPRRADRTHRAGGPRARPSRT